MILRYRDATELQNIPSSMCKLIFLPRAIPAKPWGSPRQWREWADPWKRDKRSWGEHGLLTFTGYKIPPQYVEHVHRERERERQNYLKHSLKLGSSCYRNARTTSANLCTRTSFGCIILLWNIWKQRADLFCSLSCRVFHTPINCVRPCKQCVTFSLGSILFPLLVRIPTSCRTFGMTNSSDFLDRHRDNSDLDSLV